MKTLKRYQFFLDMLAECNCDMKELPGGEFVKFTDAESDKSEAVEAALKAEREKVERLLVASRELQARLDRHFGTDSPYAQEQCDWQEQTGFRAALKELE